MAVTPTQLALLDAPRVACATLLAVDDLDDLVQRSRQGDHEAFRQLFRRYRADVARVVGRMARGPQADLEDLVQEVFFQVHRSIGSFGGRSHFKTWLYRVAVNVVLMHRRARRSRPKLVDEEACGQPPAADVPLPDEQTATRARLRAFERVLEQLSEKKRTVFILHEVQGLSPGEIASIVDAPVLTVRTRLFYARRELTALLASEPVLEALAAEFGALRGGAPHLDTRKGEPL